MEQQDNSEIFQFILNVDQHFYQRTVGSYWVRFMHILLSIYCSIYRICASKDTHACTHTYMHTRTRAHMHTHKRTLLISK